MRTIKLLKSTLQTLEAIADTGELNPYGQELILLEIMFITQEIKTLEMEALQNA